MSKFLSRDNNTQASINAQSSQSPNGMTASPVSFKAGRVKSIVLDENHPRFNELGGYNAIGYIEFQDITTASTLSSVAKPYFGNIKNVPLLEEIVWLISLPNTNLNPTPEENGNKGGITTSVSTYYICPTALWNHPHHNAFPLDTVQLPDTQQKDYRQTEVGNVNKATDQVVELNLGKTFIERSNIHPLKPFEGDTIYEGRWGNSIRFSSTVKTKPPTLASLNNWSTGNSVSGDPIIILRNGQGQQNDEGWIPVTENIDNDESSIYLTSTQKIPLKSSSTNYSSYLSNPPINPGLFEGKQVIINSGRLVFNSNNDHILLSSNKSVGLNAVESINIDTPLTVVQSDKILLGSKNATEPMLKGNLLIIELQSLLTQLTLLTTSLQAVPQASAAATLMLSELPKISANLEKTKSQVNKLI